MMGVLYEMVSEEAALVPYTDIGRLAQITTIIWQYQLPSEDGY